jgi:hypothetical protein
VITIINQENNKGLNLLILSNDIGYFKDIDFPSEIAGIQVAPCTQNAKSLVVDGINAFVTSFENEFTDQALSDRVKSSRAEGKVDFKQALAELQVLGINPSNLRYLVGYLGE